MTHNTKYRYFYFKNGDVAAQVRRVLDLNGRPPDGGPDAFIADFLTHGDVADVAVAAFLDRDQEERHGTVRSRTYSNVGLLARLGTLFRFPMEILAFKPERILCGRQGYALAVCLLAGRLLGAPVVFSAHNRLSGQAAGIKGRLRDGLDAWLIRRCHAAICHGPYLARELADIGLPASRVTAFDSGCADLLPEGANAPMAPAFPPRILFLGRMVREKGIFDLLHAFRAATASGRDAHLVYAGDGADRPALEALAQELGLAQRVKFLGPVPHGEIGGVVREAWAMVTPTRSEFPEGRCMAAMEALAMGVPVVAPDDGPFPYLVRDGENGLLFAQDSVDALAQALARLLADPAWRDRLSSNAFKERGCLLKPEVGFAQAATLAIEKSSK